MKRNTYKAISTEKRVRKTLRGIQNLVDQTL